jgi:hypothetical protein
MACETEMWLHAKNVTTFCPHPALTFCTDCRIGLCSSHIVECEICDMFLCQDCTSEHYRNHERLARQTGRAS